MTIASKHWWEKLLLLLPCCGVTVFEESDSEIDHELDVDHIIVNDQEDESPIDMNSAPSLQMFLDFEIINIDKED